MRAVTAAQMKGIEKRADMAGLSYTQMMENAGREAYRVIGEEYNCKSVVVLTGKGNNGGDGYVVARCLAEAGTDVFVIMAEGEPVTEDARFNFGKCETMGISMTEFDEHAAKRIYDADLIVDAVYGSGFHGSLRENMMVVFDCVRGSSAGLCSLDLPSGINADNGEAADGALCADVTVVFDSLKKAHTKSSAQKYFGKIVLADIGIPEKCRDEVLFAE